MTRPFPPHENAPAPLLPRTLARALIHALPREFNASFGHDIERSLLDQYRDELRRFGSVRPAFWPCVLLDLAATVYREWAEHITTHLQRRHWRIVTRAVGGGVLTLGAAANVVYDLAHPKLSMGVSAILATAFGAVGGFTLIRSAFSIGGRPSR